MKTPERWFEIISSLCERPPGAMIASSRLQLVTRLPVKLLSALTQPTASDSFLNDPTIDQEAVYGAETVITNELQ